MKFLHVLYLYEILMNGDILSVTLLAKNAMLIT